MYVKKLERLTWLNDSRNRKGHRECTRLMASFDIYLENKEICFKRL